MRVIVFPIYHAMLHAIQLQQRVETRVFPNTYLLLYKATSLTIINQYSTPPKIKARTLHKYFTIFSSCTNIQTKCG